MTDTLITPQFVRRARLAGVLYLIIIIAGLSAELALRGPLITSGDAGATAAAILGAPMQFRLAIVADICMAASDTGLAVLLYLILRPVAPGLALCAMVFRLIQAVLIAANLMALQGAWLVLTLDSGIDAAEAQGLALILMEIHAHGYDLGLVFFGINSLMTAMLLWRSGVFAKVFGVGLAVAGGVYLIGSALRFVAPDLYDLFVPAYGLTILAEGAFCLRLLSQPASKQEWVPMIEEKCKD